MEQQERVWGLDGRIWLFMLGYAAAQWPCVTLDTLLNLSEPQFICLQNTLLAFSLGGQRLHQTADGRGFVTVG